MMPEQKNVSPANIVKPYHLLFGLIWQASNEAAARPENVYFLCRSWPKDLCDNFQRQMPNSTVTNVCARSFVFRLGLAIDFELASACCCFVLFLHFASVLFCIAADFFFLRLLFSLPVPHVFGYNFVTDFMYGSRMFTCA